MYNRHAYLIMAYNNYDLLAEILRDLDDEENDIFLHMDAKSVDAPMEQLEAAVEKARFFNVSRLKVNWAGYSQIACEVHLLETALKQGPHMYYHLITGATCPIYSQEKIHAYFKEHYGDEFIGYVSEGDYLHRVQQINLFNEIGKPVDRKQDQMVHIRELFKAVQRRLHYVYGPARNITFYKGFAYWSLTQKAAEYVVSKKKWIAKVFRHSICGDEVFVQTILYHSPFRARIHDSQSEYGSCLRYVKPSLSWQGDFGETAATSSGSENGILPEDISDIMNSGKLFALKFVGKSGLEAFKMLKSTRE